MNDAAVAANTPTTPANNNNNNNQPSAVMTNQPPAANNNQPSAVMTNQPSAGNNNQPSAANAPIQPVFISRVNKVCVKNLMVVKNQKQFLDKELFSYIEGNFDGKVRKVVILIDSDKLSNKCQKLKVYPKHLKTKNSSLRNRFNVFGLRLLQLNNTFYSAIASEFYWNKIALFQKKNRCAFEPKDFDGDAAFNAIASRVSFGFERFRDAYGRMANFLVLRDN